MASFGIEGIRHFSNLRASGAVAKAEDLHYVFNICNGLYRELNKGGHTCSFYYANRDCWEIDMRDTSLGGIDKDIADNVDLFFILTHGRLVDNNTTLFYDIDRDKWQGSFYDWRFGDKWDLEWLLIYSCRTINRKRPLDFWHVFQGLHIFCGAYGEMWDGITTDEVGEDVGDNLTDGRTVAWSWIEGVSDWWADNHPMVLAIEKASTWNGGNVDWPNTTMGRDHLWGHGITVVDIKPAEKYYMSCWWAEG
ncbi:MAG: hypothetical protein DYG98_27865 [Haliscomenobacteraceae bacterium CHB4]|nr:hypothetical protein [Saprospiraceae bacterium]MCE7926870.1 hypothetical protein [Haliscomenobacteraceae bacterium CHB4]